MDFGLTNLALLANRVATNVFADEIALCEGVHDARVVLVQNLPNGARFPWRRR